MVLPEKGVACHKTFARLGGPIDCHTLVCKHNCQLWQRVSEIVDRDPETGEPIAKDKFACLEVLQGMFWKDMLRRQYQTTATVDKLSKEVKETNAGAMGALLGSVNQQLRELGHMPKPEQPMLTNGADAPKLLEG